jgi:hypothetical protein
VVHNVERRCLDASDATVASAYRVNHSHSVLLLALDAYRPITSARSTRAGQQLALRLVRTPFAVKRGIA